MVETLGPAAGGAVTRQTVDQSVPALRAALAASPDLRDVKISVFLTGNNNLVLFASTASDTVRQALRSGAEAGLEQSGLRGQLSEADTFDEAIVSADGHQPAPGESGALVQFPMTSSASVDSVAKGIAPALQRGDLQSMLVLHVGTGSASRMALYVLGAQPTTAVAFVRSLASQPPLETNPTDINEQSVAFLLSM